MIKKLVLGILVTALSPLYADTAEKEKALLQAARTKNGPRVITLSRELVATGERSAIEAVINYAFLCDSYKAERSAAFALSKLPPDKRNIVRKAALNTRSNYKIRVVLAAVLTLYDDRQSFLALCDMAADPYPPVVVAALSQIVKLGNVKAVGPLIDVLAKRERYGGVVPAEIERALRALTGVVEDYTSSEWRKWWEPRKNTFTREEALKQKGLRRRTVVRSRNTFFGIEVVSKHILFILDMSGSMKKRDKPIPGAADGGSNSGLTGTGRTRLQKKQEPQLKQEAAPDALPRNRERLYRVQQELIKTIKNLTPDTYFTVMAFNHEIKMLTDTPKPATASFKEQAVQFAQSFRPEGETWTDKAMEKAFELRDKIDTIYLLSDGYPQRQQKLIDMEKIIRYIKEENRFRKIEVNTVGFVQVGRQMARFLATIAKQNGGVYKELQ